MEGLRKGGCLFHLLICNSKIIWELMITDGKVETKKAGPFIMALPEENFIRL